MKSILIIDDDLSLCLLLEKVLSKKYSVNCCNNAMDALCWLTEGNQPDLIVTDIIMPSITGIELLEQLRESGLFKSIPVIVLSGLDDPEKKRRSIDLGADAFLLKPFTPEMLVETIDELLEGKSQIESLTLKNNNNFYG